MFIALIKFGRVHSEQRRNIRKKLHILLSDTSDGYRKDRPIGSSLSYMA